MEIRLNKLQNHVEYFVILKSATTFTGLPKNLTLSQNWSRFQQFKSRIIYHVLETPPDSSSSWGHEIQQRNAMCTQVLPFLKGHQAPNQGDVVLVSDIDELPKPATLTLLHNCEFLKRLTLRSKFYCERTTVSNGFIAESNGRTRKQLLTPAQTALSFRKTYVGDTMLHSLIVRRRIGGIRRGIVVRASRRLRRCWGR